jgi:signal transduction histidine kinase
MSNALKFTPAEGQVHIVRKFIPSTGTVSPDITPTSEAGGFEGRQTTLSSIMREAVRSKFNSSAVFITNMEVDVLESENGMNGTIRIEVHDTGYGISLVSQLDLPSLI